MRERHKDLRLYWDRWEWVSNAAESLQKQEVSQMAFMVVCGAPPEKQENIGELSVGRRERKMAPVIKVMVWSEESRCQWR